MPKKLSLFLCLALLCAVFSAFPARAASDPGSTPSFVPGRCSPDGFWGITYAENGVDDTDALFPPADGGVLCPLRDGIWEGEGPFRTTRLYFLSSPDDPDERLSMLTAIFPRSAPEDGGDEVVFRMDLSEFSLNAEKFSLMRFGVCFEEAEGDYPLSLSLATDGGRLDAALTVSTADAPVRNGGIVRSETGWSVVTVDLSGTAGAVKELEVRLWVERENMPARVYLSGPSFETGSTEVLRLAETYSSVDLGASEPGGFSRATGQAFCDSAGKLLLSGEFSLPPDSLTPGVPAFFAVETEGIGAGSLTLGLDYENGFERVWSRPVVLSGAGDLAVVCVEPLSAVRSFALSFDGMEANSAFRVRSVRVYTGGSVPVSGNDWLGHVTRLERNGDSVFFGGSMTRDAARRFSGGNIGFYALPSPLLDPSYDPADLLAGASLIGQTKVSTRFEVTLSSSALPVPAGACLFFAAVPDEDGSLMPLSAPRIAGIAGDRNAPERELSSFGLAEASPVGVFESNASRVFVDIRLDELIGTSGGVPVVYAAPGESEWQSVSLSSSGIAELERDVQFYLSAGIDVYLRFFIGSPVPGLTAPDAPEGLPGYAPDTGSPSAVSLWRALIAYFSAKFPEAGGIVLPGPVNDPDSAGGADPGDPAEWAERLARLCELTYGAAADANPDVFIVLPLLEDGGEGAVPPRLLTVMTARRIGEFGDIPWAVLSVSAMESAVPAAVQGTMTMLDSQSLGKPDTVLYLCRPSQSELDRGYLAYTAIPARERTDALSPAEFFAKEYLRFAEACGKQAHAVFVSLEDIVWRNDHDFYDMLKRMIGTGEGVFSAQAQSMPGFRSLSRAVIWDFAGSYHSSGWIPGGGALSCVSEPSPLFSDSRGAPSRILSVRFQQTGSGGVAGIVMRNLTPTADLSDVSALVFDFTLEAVGAEDGNGADTNRVAMVFVVGTDEKRAEFYADGIRCGEICSLGCDLTGWADRDRVDYIGIAVYADFDVSLKLERVTAGSRTAAPEEIGKIFSPVRETPQERPDESWLLPVFVIAAAAVFAVFVLLTRRDAEEADRKKQDGTYERSPR